MPKIRASLHKKMDVDEKNIYKTNARQLGLYKNEMRKMFSSKEYGETFSLHKIRLMANIVAIAIVLIFVNPYVVSAAKGGNIKITVGDKDQLERDAEYKKEVNIKRAEEKRKKREQKEKKTIIYSEATAERPYKITAIGDSITYSNTYAAIIDSLPQCIVNNLGVSGTQVAGEIEHSFVNRTKSLKTDSDLILIFGGTNDYRGAYDAQNNIGSLEDTDIVTFCGAYNTMITNLKKNNPNSKIVLITPIRRSYDYEENRYGYSLESYAKAVKYIAMKNELPCIDLYNNEKCDFRYDGHLIDGLHPNYEGHEIIANEILKALVQAGL